MFCSCSYVAIDSVGELGVNEARSLVGLEYGRRGRRVMSPFMCLWACGTSSPSSRISSMEKGLLDLLLDGPSTVGARVEIRTQFCRLCPFRDPGLPFIADGFADSVSLVNWNGVVLLLESVRSMAEIGRCGVTVLPDTVRSTFLRSAGEPFTDTRDPAIRLFVGVLTILKLVSLLSELHDETRATLSLSAVPIVGIDSRLKSLSRDDLILETVVRLLTADFVLKRAEFLNAEEESGREFCCSWPI